MDTKELSQSIDNIIKHLTDEFNSLRSNRPNVKMVEDIKVDVYGQKMPIKQIASITISPPREISMTAWDTNNAKPIANAVTESLSITPRIDGANIHIELPVMTEERKNEITKIAGQIAEEARIKIRSLRDIYNKKIESQEKSGEITEDNKFTLKEEIQKIIDEANHKIEDLLKNKIEDLKQ